MSDIESQAPMRSISDKQLAANRRNATRSTGPRTPEGKARAAQNAIQHGLCAQRITLPGEDAHEWAVFHHQFLLDLQPNDALERLMVDRIALAAWRLQRAAHYENSLIEREIAKAERGVEESRRFADKFGKPQAAKRNDGEAIGASAVNACLAGKAFGALNRYETGIERGMFKAIDRFERLRATREALPRRYARNRRPADPYDPMVQEPIYAPPPADTREAAPGEADFAKRTHFGAVDAQESFMPAFTDDQPTGSQPGTAGLPPSGQGSNGRGAYGRVQHPSPPPSNGPR